MAAGNLRIPHVGVRVENMEKKRVVPDDQGECVTVQFWNAGCTNKDCWTGRICPVVSFKNEKGEVITTTKRTRFLHYCVQMVVTAACDMLGLVD